MSGSSAEVHWAGSVQLADLIGGLGALSPCFVALAAADAMRPGTPLLVAGAAHDDRLATYHARARALRNASLVIWIGEGFLAAAADDGWSRPCVHCALLFDRTFHHGARSGTGDGRDDKGPRRVAELIAERFASPAAWPALGHAWTVDLAGGTARTERYLPHPSCDCAAAKDSGHAPLPATLDIDGARERRFAPVSVLPDRGDDALAQALFRKDRSPWPAGIGKFGSTAGFGANAPDRALAGAIERFCMLHAPPDRSGVSACDLSEPILPEAPLRSLLFRAEESSTPGFRFPDYDDRRPHDWCWLERCADGKRVLVPASVVGSPGPGAVRLADATPNGTPRTATPKKR